MSPHYILPSHLQSHQTSNYNNDNGSHRRCPRGGQSTLSVHFPSNDDASLVTSIHTRPYTPIQDIPLLYYTASDIAEFKADYKHYKRTTRNRNQKSLFWMRRRMIRSSNEGDDGDSDSDHGAYVYSSLAVAMGAPIREDKTISSCSGEYYDYDADDESLIAAISDDEDDSMDSMGNDSSLSLGNEKIMSTAYETPTSSTYQHESYYQEGESILNAVFDLAMDVVASVSKQGSLLSRSLVGYGDQNSRRLQEEKNDDPFCRRTVPSTSSSQQQFASTMQLVDTLYLLKDI